MSVQAKVKYADPATVFFTAGATLVPGEVIAVPDGRLGIVSGAKGFVSGEAASAVVQGTHEFTKKSADVVAAGVRIYWDTALNQATITAAGNTFLGTANEAAGSGVLLLDVALNVDIQLRPLEVGITDPGDAGAIPVTTSGYVPLVSVGAETRTLAAPTFIGQEMLIYFKTDGGNCVVTCATTFNETGNNTATFTDTGEALKLIAVEEGANLRWRTLLNDGAAYSTV